MRQHINHGMNVHSMNGIRQMQAVVAHRDVRVDVGPRPGKRLKKSWPSTGSLTRGFTLEQSGCEQLEAARPVAGYPAARAAAFEAPAAAWAALVVSRAISA